MNDLQELIANFENLPVFVRFRNNLNISADQAIVYVVRCYFAEKLAEIAEFGRPVLVADVPLNAIGDPMLDHDGFQSMVKSCREQIRKKLELTHKGECVYGEGNCDQCRSSQ